MPEVESLLVTLPSLKHFELQTFAFKDLQNGYQWKNLLSSFNSFNFHFNFAYILDDKVLKDFRTPFWLKQKRWLVAYQGNSLFSIPHFSPKILDICRSSHIESTANSNKFPYGNIKKSVISRRWIRYNGYLPNINDLELQCSTSLKTISSIMALSQIKSLSILSFDTFEQCLPVVTAMSHLSELSISETLTMDMIQTINDYHFQQIFKLRINIHENRTDYIIEKLSTSFPNVEHLILEVPIRSKHTIVLAIDAFKYLLNVSFFDTSSFYKKKFDFCSNQNSIARCSQRLSKSNFTCQLKNKYRVGFGSCGLSVHYWIENEVSHPHGVIVCCTISFYLACTFTNAGPDTRPKIPLVSITISVITNFSQLLHIRPRYFISDTFIVRSHTIYGYTRVFQICYFSFK